MEELEAIQYSLAEKGYTEILIENYLKLTASEPKGHTTERKRIMSELPFKGDAATEIIQRQSSTSISSTYLAIKLQVILTKYLTTLERSTLPSGHLHVH